MKSAITYILVSVFWLSACSPMRSSIPLQGDFLNLKVDTTVDDPIASYYVKSYLAGVSRNQEWDTVFNGIHTQLGDRIPTSKEAAYWSNEYSTDLAALIIARQLFRAAERQPLYRLFREELATVENLQHFGSLQQVRIDPDLLFIFVPGWLYRSDPTTGADFASLRKLLNAHGAHVVLAQSAENASVEENAKRLAAQIRGYSAAQQQIVIVSGSKGGPETALALSMLGDTSEYQSIKAWINIGGLLQGSPLADFGLTWPVCWFVEIAVLPDGSFDGIRSLTVEQSSRRWQKLHIPKKILIVNYLGIPLSGDISKQARDGYSQLREKGPNDGLTLLIDALAPSGVTIPEFGVDHYFRHPEIEAKTLSLARAVARYVKQNAAQQGVPADALKHAVEL